MALGLLTGAEAADLGHGGMKDYGYSYPAIASPSWYVRIDGGYGVHDAPVMVDGGIHDLTDTSIGGAWTIGGGIGRYFSESVRGDVTVDHRFDADVEGINGQPGQGKRTFGLSSTVALANVYYDFGNRSHFTPYIGAGLGFVHHETSKGTAVGANCGQTCVITGDDNWHVAGALMAGFSVQLTGHRGHAMSHGSIKDVVVESNRGLHLDAGYRFLYLGETTGGRVVCPNDTCKGPTVENIHAHEFRLGLRYDLR
jgi:opacity protein-like surface antigen